MFSGTGGEHCEEQSYGFEELSYMEFPPLDPRNNVIFFELATVRENSLLLHNHGDNLSSEFLALELIGGEVQLSYNLGDGVVRLKTQKKLTDGLFHSITARRTGKVSHCHLRAARVLVGWPSDCAHTAQR